MWTGRRTKGIYQFDPLGKKQRHDQLVQEQAGMGSDCVVPVGHAFVSFLPHCRHICPFVRRKWCWMDGQSTKRSSFAGDTSFNMSFCALTVHPVHILWVELVDSFCPPATNLVSPLSGGTSILRISRLGTLIATPTGGNRRRNDACRTCSRVSGRQRTSSSPFPRAAWRKG